jgi:ABC-type branched-subunit amino acid transport system ATPase component
MTERAVAQRNASLLACHGLTMRFGGLLALDALDLHVAGGEILGLIGPNGSGKTTFFNVLTGLYRPSAGRVEFAGRDITGASPQQV